MTKALSIIRIASAASLWRGLEYSREGRVVGLVSRGDGVFDAEVRGNGSAPYRVHVDTRHVHSSTCTCPFVQGNKKICKHMLATVFAAMPDQIDALNALVEQDRREAEAWEEEHRRELWARVMRLKKSELQRQLYQAWLELEDRQRNGWW